MPNKEGYPECALKFLGHGGKIPLGFPIGPPSIFFRLEAFCGLVQNFVRPDAKVVLLMQSEEDFFGLESLQKEMEGSRFRELNHLVGRLDDVLSLLSHRAENFRILAEHARLIRQFAPANTLMLPIGSVDFSFFASSDGYYIVKPTIEMSAGMGGSDEKIVADMFDIFETRWRQRLG